LNETITMLPKLKLKDPPIKEALISIVFSHPKGVKLSDFDEFCMNLNEEYPNKENKFEKTISFEFNSDVVSNEEKPFGYVFSSKDKKKYIKLDVSSMSFHRVEPYESWENLMVEVKQYWGKFCYLFSEIQIQQISVRYVNVIALKLDEGGIKFEDYLTLLPQIPDTLPKVVEGYFMQVKIPDLTKNLHSVVTEFFTITQGQVEITLDINVMKNLESLLNNDINLWNIFNDLRDYKNKIFFESITEKTKKLYNE
jgi:uncharacterized protein (TIGR04255 family)